jgi:hypothetical protein
MGNKKQKTRKTGFSDRVFASVGVAGRIQKTACRGGMEPDLI